MSAQLLQTAAFRPHLTAGSSLYRLKSAGSAKFGCGQNTGDRADISRQGDSPKKPVITAYDKEKDGDLSKPVQTCLKMIAWYQRKTRLKLDGTPRGRSIFPCPYTPSCSEYTADAIRKYGVIKGILKGSYRILRCNPFNNTYNYFFRKDAFNDTVK